MHVRQGSIVTALQSKPLSITATCFQYHEYGRRTGLKIRWCEDEDFATSNPPFNAHGRSPPTASKAVLSVKHVLTSIASHDSPKTTTGGEHTRERN